MIDSRTPLVLASRKWILPVYDIIVKLIECKCYRWTTARIRPIVCPLDSKRKWQCDYIIPSYEGYVDNHGPIFTRAYPIRRQVSTYRFIFLILIKKMFPFTRTECLLAKHF
jgi:hypothetical protein